MIVGYSPIVQAFLGTLFTWGLTAAGSALVFIFSSSQRKVLDGSLGFAAGVMLAASYWSLLSPAIEMASTSGLYGEDGAYAFLPVSIGFLLGAAFVLGSDMLLPALGITSSEIAFSFEKSKDDNTEASESSDPYFSGQIKNELNNHNLMLSSDHTTVKRKKDGNNPSFVHVDDNLSKLEGSPSKSFIDQRRWRRILLLIIAITVHNIPEGLAVGVGFGAIGKSKSATFENARNLAIGIGIQNFPEGLAVSLPLRGSGYSTLRSFWYGQLSGMVEPIAGILGAFAVTIAEPVLPYALAFAAGAMVYVVVDDIVPEAQTCGNGRLASMCTIVGFIVMMALDVGLG